jgi:hypothetical protein
MHVCSFNCSRNEIALGARLLLSSVKVFNVVVMKALSQHGNEHNF